MPAVPAYATLVLPYRIPTNRQAQRQLATDLIHLFSVQRDYVKFLFQVTGDKVLFFKSEKLF